MDAAISPDDTIARCLIYPQIFAGNIHVNSKLWEFGKRDEHGASHLSAYLRRLVPLDSDLHQIGCKVAHLQNSGMKERLQTEALPSDKQRYYCGFRQANVGQLLATNDNSEYTIAITLQPEFGEEAHVDVSLTISTEVPKNRQALLRTDAGIALAACFSEAIAHVCHCDNDDENHPFERLGHNCIHILPGPFQGHVVQIPDQSVQPIAISDNKFSQVFEAPLLSEKKID